MFTSPFLAFTISSEGEEWCVFVSECMKLFKCQLTSYTVMCREVVELATDLELKMAHINLAASGYRNASI